MAKAALWSVTDAEVVPKLFAVRILFGQAVQPVKPAFECRTVWHLPLLVPEVIKFSYNALHIFVSFLKL